MDDMIAFERLVAGRIQHHAGPIRPVDDLAVYESITAASQSHSWGFTMFSALKFVVAGVIVALFGGFLLTGILTTQQGDEARPAAVTQSPSPMTSEELLSGMVTEEVEPGVFRVDHDGVRDLSSADYESVFVGHDGSIWLASRAGHLSRLGVAETHDWKLGEEDRNLMDLEIAPDGTIWAAVVESDGSEAWSELRSFDGAAWTTHAVAPFVRLVGDVEIAPDGVVWAALADGSFGYVEAGNSTWQTIETPMTPQAFDTGEYGFVATESGLWARHRTGIWHYSDGAWEDITYRDPDAGTMPDGVFWGIGPGATGDDETLFRHDGSGWQRWSLREHRMLGSWSIAPHAVAPDGSFWAAWSGRGALGTPDALGVNRFDGRTWVRFLPGMESFWQSGMDIAPDGSVWVLAGIREPDAVLDPDLYVITPEAVGAE